MVITLGLKKKDLPSRAPRRTCWVALGPVSKGFPGLGTPNREAQEYGRVASEKLKYGFKVLFGFGIRGRSHSNFPDSTLGR